jgi:LPS-assembly protein
MKKLPTILAFTLGSLALPGSLFGEAQTGIIVKAKDGQSALSYDFASGQAEATNGVMVVYGDAVLTADRATVDYESYEVVADGEVHIQHGDQVWTGDHIRYNFKTFQMQAAQFRTGKPPVFATGEGLHADITNHLYSATNAFLTTDDVAKPAMRIRAQSIEIIPGDKIIARHAVLYLGDVPVFYFPYYSRPLDERANHFNFIPGYRGSYGAFLMSSYTWYLNDQLDGDARFDYRQKRGVGTGADFNYHFGPWGEGWLKYYYLHDRDPNRDATDLSNPEKSAAHQLRLPGQPGDEPQHQGRRPLPGRSRHRP